MSYKRAEWHSGLTYRQTCECCNTTVEYNDYSLDFRPWYADGFVYCPKCKTPLRHNEKYATNAPKPTVVDTQASSENTGVAKFCTQCGKPFAQGDRFCSQCGNKR